MKAVHFTVLLKRNAGMDPPALRGSVWSTSAFLTNRKLVHVDVSASLCVSETGGRSMTWSWKQSACCNPTEGRPGGALPWAKATRTSHLLLEICSNIRGSASEGASLSTPRNLHRLHKNYIKTRSRFPVKYKSTCVLHEIKYGCKNTTHPTLSKRSSCSSDSHRWTQGRTKSERGLRLWFCTTCAKGVLFAQDGVKVCQPTEPGGLLEWDRDWMWGM